jgi:hypothetical protein
LEQPCLTGGAVLFLEGERIKAVNRPPAARQTIPLEFFLGEFMKLDLTEAQINEWPDGSVEVVGKNDCLHFKGRCAEDVRAAYRQFLESYPADAPSLKIAVNIEVPQPVGQWMSEL